MTDATITAPRDISREELVAELRALRRLFAREGVTHMVLFGSRARRDNRPDSDVDLMIEVDPARKFSLVELSGVELTVQDHFELPASVVLRRSASPTMLAAADRDGIPLF